MRRYRHIRVHRISVCGLLYATALILCLSLCQCAQFRIDGRVFTSAHWHFGVRPAVSCAENPVTVKDCDFGFTVQLSTTEVP